MADTITAREFFLNTFDTDFLTEPEKDTIIEAMELFAKGKCKEQRNLCHDAYMTVYESGKDDEDAILNAPEPNF